MSSGPPQCERLVSVVADLGISKSFLIAEAVNPSGSAKLADRVLASVDVSRIHLDFRIPPADFVEHFLSVYFSVRQPEISHVLTVTMGT